MGGNREGKGWKGKERKQCGPSNENFCLTALPQTSRGPTSKARGGERGEGKEEEGMGGNREGKGWKGKGRGRRGSNVAPPMKISAYAPDRQTDRFAILEWLG